MTKRNRARTKFWTLLNNLIHAYQYNQIMMLKEMYSQAVERSAELECARRIEQEQRRLFSGEISEDEYDQRYNKIMDDRRLRILALLPK